MNELTGGDYKITRKFFDVARYGIQGEQYSDQSQH